MALGLIVPTAAAQDAPLFFRPFDGVPVAAEDDYIRIVPESMIDSGDDHLRQLDPGGGPDSLPPNLPPRFMDETTTPATTGMPIGMAFFGQFVDHDVALTRTRFDELLIEPFVFAYVVTADGTFRNRRTPGFDLDPLYRINPLEYPSSPGALGPWDVSNLRFRFLTNDLGGLDFFRGASGIAVIGDSRNDQNGVIIQIHQAFMMLHNRQVNRIIERDGIDEATLEFLSPEWWDVFNEARNYTTAYYQGILANEFMSLLVGRTLWDALEDADEPVGGLASPRNTVEAVGAVFRLHTMIPNEVPVRDGVALDPVDQALRTGVRWPRLFGPTAAPAARFDTAVAAPLRDIVNLVIPGTFIPVTLDLAQVNLLRGREMRLPSGEEYLAHLADELGIPGKAKRIRGKLVLTAANAARILDPVDDADLLADIQDGDTDLWAYVAVEAVLNGERLGPVGQDILERTWLGLLLGDDWSLFGARSDEFTPDQMAFFRTATFERMLTDALSPADVSRDGRVGMTDLIELLGAWGDAGGGGPADIDGDGTVNEADIFALFDEWGWPFTD